MEVVQRGTGPTVSRAGRWGSGRGALGPWAACPVGACSLEGTAAAAVWVGTASSHRTGEGSGTSAHVR